MSIIRSSDSDYTARLQGVRLFINTQYDEDDIPQSTLENDIYLGAANRKIAKRVPNFASLPEADQLDTKVVVQKEMAIAYLKSELELMRETLLDRTIDQRGLAIEKRIQTYELENETTLKRVAPSTSPSDATGDGMTVLISTQPAW